MKLSNNTSRVGAEWISQNITYDNSPFGMLHSQYQILRDKTNSGADSRFFVARSHFFCQSFTCNLKHTLRHTRSNTHWGSQRDNRGIVGSRESDSIFRRVYKQLAESTQTQTRSSLLFVTVTLSSLALPQRTLASDRISPLPVSASHCHSHFCLSFFFIFFLLLMAKQQLWNHPQYICTY